MTTTQESRLEANDYEIMCMLDGYSIIRQLKDKLMEHIYSEDWGDIKHMPIDDTCMAMDLDDIKEIVNEYGVLEIMDLIRDNYGDEFIISILEKEKDMRYRSLFYNILDEYIERHKTVCMDLDDYDAGRGIYAGDLINPDDSDDSDDSDDTCDSDTASSAETDEEN